MTDVPGSGSACYIGPFLSDGDAEDLGLSTEIFETYERIPNGCLVAGRTEHKRPAEVQCFLTVFNQN